MFIGTERFNSGHVLTFSVYGQSARVQLFLDNDGVAAYRVAWYGEGYGNWFKFTTTVTSGG